MPVFGLVRRALAPVLVVAEIVLLAAFVLLAVIGLLAAVVDRRRRLFRIAALAVTYLASELVCLAALFGVWVLRRRRPGEWWVDVNTRLLEWLLGAVLGGARRWVGFDVELEEPPVHEPLDQDLPVLVLARHGGLGDSFVLVWLLIRRYRRVPRIVLKSVLRWEPVIDVALTRLGACFLPRNRSRSEDLPARLGELASRLDGRDVLLIFPEGGNWTPQRRHRAIARLRADRRHQAASAAALMEHVLPPRPAGVFACVDARPDLPLVVVAHAGIDHLVTAGQVWGALPFRRPMVVRWWPVAAPPPKDDARLEWLTREWAIVDEWIDFQRAGATPDPAR